MSVVSLLPGGHYGLLPPGALQFHCGVSRVNFFYLSWDGFHVLPEDQVLCLSAVLGEFQSRLCWILLLLYA